MPDLPLTLFDAAVIVVIALSALFSLVRGATREALTIAAWLGAFVVAYYAFVPVQRIAQQTIERDWVADVVSAIVVFVLPLIVFKVIGAVLAEHVQGRRLVSSVDRWLGVVFGLARGALIVCVAYLGLSVVVRPEQYPDWVRDARLLPYVEDGAMLLRDLLPREAGGEAGAAPTGAALAQAEGTSW